MLGQPPKDAKVKQIIEFAKKSIALATSKSRVLELKIVTQGQELFSHHIILKY
ncbi:MULTISPECIES: hypothetical protein [unclassified Microcoleus]|uniref:hypothetical protein n=1 Tax=unclassified Microcoleus TaxID=2642155 RepID=UPI002FD214CC